MKKFLFLFVLCTLISSCSSQDDSGAPITESSNEVDSLLISQLQGYNNTVINQQITRGTIRKGAILMSDVCGGVVGLKQGVSAGRWILGATGGTGIHLVALGALGWTVLQSAYASHKAYQLLHEIECDDNSNRNFVKYNVVNKFLYRNFNRINNNRISFINDALVVTNDSIYDSIGRMHNDILSDVWNSSDFFPIDDGGSLGLLSFGGSINMQSTTLGLEEDDLIELNPIEENQYQMNSYGISTLTDNYVEMNFGEGLQGLEALCATDDYESYLDDLQSQNYMSQNVKFVIKLLYESLMLSVSTEQDLNDRIDTYKTFVNNATNLSNNDKQLLYQCLEIARYSYKHWSSQGML